MHANQGDVLLPLSTLKRTDAQSVLLNWTQSKVKQTYKQMSGEGGQATNSLPIMQQSIGLNQIDVFVVDHFFHCPHGAHFTAHGAAVLMFRCGFSAIAAGFFAIQRQFKLGFPI